MGNQSRVENPRGFLRASRSILNDADYEERPQQMVAGAGGRRKCQWPADSRLQSPSNTSPAPTSIPPQPAHILARCSVINRCLIDPTEYSIHRFFPLSAAMSLVAG